MKTRVLEIKYYSHDSYIPQFRWLWLWFPIDPNHGYTKESAIEKCKEFSHKSSRKTYPVT
jgi:hypothetical protein